MSVGYPSIADEIAVLDRQQFVHPIDTLEQVVSVEELLTAQTDVKTIHVDVQLKAYVVDIVTQTRKHADVYLGASPRGSLALYRASQARAAVNGRDYVIPDDVKALAESALAHRVIIGPAARIKNVDSRSVIRDILAHLPVP